MTAEGQFHLFRLYTTAIISYGNISRTRFLGYDIDRSCPGVKRVFDQFLDNRSRSFDYFAGRNFVYEDLIKLPDRPPCDYAVTLKMEDVLP